MVVAAFGSQLQVKQKKHTSTYKGFYITQKEAVCCKFILTCVFFKQSSSVCFYKQKDPDEATCFEMAAK